MPDNIAVTVNVDEKGTMGKIPVTFAGGAGQGAVKSVEVILTKIDGTTEIQYIKPERGAQVIMNGTAGSGMETGQGDRVQVIVHMYSGDSYTVADVIREYRARA